MKNSWSFKKDNSGVSLIAVVVAIVFVGIIGMVIIQTTVTNIAMKEVENSTKVNFYSAETISDELSSGLNDKASVAMKEAYTKTLSNYRDVMTFGNNIQDDFSLKYMNQLKNVFECSVATKDDPISPTYEVGTCSFAKVQECLSDASKSYLVTPDSSEVKYHLDYANGVFVIKDLEIKYTDTNHYETDIHTDVVFHTPVLNFTGTNIVKDFMRYSVIANHTLSINSPSVIIDGNAYAGAGGIVCGTNGSVNMNGATIVTRGDILAKPGAVMNVGTATSKVYAENIMTSGSGSPAKLCLDGNIYVSDDLTLDGTSTTATASLVTLKGNYYGYNFQKLYDSVTSEKNASYSSAIVINGKNTKLDMTDLNYLLLAGRTYIARNTAAGDLGNDVALGESVSVRSNQMAYFVPSAFLDFSSTPVTFKPTGAEDCANFMGVSESDIVGNVNIADPVAAYNYVDSGMTYTVYYLKFSGEQAANNFFAAYASANHATIKSYADNYLVNDALVISPTMLYSLKGDLLYRENAGEDLKEKNVTIGSNWNQDGIYWNYAKRMAITYKSLQMYLEAHNSTVTADTIRFENENDKEKQPLFNNLINETLFSAKFVAPNTQVVDATDVNRVIVITSEDYTIDTAYKGGIIISQGNVTVNSNFNGMIIAKGTISFGTNAHVTADEVMVSQMFTADMTSGSPIFSDCFVDYNKFSESVIGEVKVDEFLTYDNWTKTAD